MRAARSRVLCVAALAWVALALLAPAERAAPGVRRAAQEGRTAVAADGSEGCLRCHEGIEDMHPAARLSCTDCHGGDATARDKLLAHVQPRSTPPGDERVAPRGEDLAWRRFVNPMDLRVVDRTCGECHGELSRHLITSLHGTTAGHLSDGFYEVGLVEEKASRYGIWPVFPYQAEPGEIERLLQVPPFRSRGPRDELATHYTDLPRKECMQCHLWSQGRAVRGRLGFDGDYRGAGCAACHVPYAVDGLSESRDRSARRHEPGHPRTHTMTRAPTTEACATCHYGDASIGLHFRGLSQLPPGAPGGPRIPGTTDAPLNRAFYLDDPALVPPDVHHERGMHCIDCHTLGDVMGDGVLHGSMEHAVEITCATCHGTFEARTDRLTERGVPLSNLVERDGEVVLVSKVTGAEHRVKQVVDVLDPRHTDHNPRAARAMTAEHADVECYTCHSGWNVNFLGFHFDRNESLTQLDLLSGLETPGRVTTQEKVFATWKSFYAGLNERGAVAPYLTGFSTFGSVTDAEGKRIVDQEMPVTAAGLSGLTMVHHQLHSVRPTARDCVECHRSSATWGMGSPNFRLARQLAFVADRRGVEVVALDRSNLAASVPLAKVVLPDVVDLEILADDLQGHAQYVFAAEGGRGVHVIDVRRPEAPRRAGFVASIGPRGMQLVGRHLWVADGEGGLRAYDVSRPETPELVSILPMFDAYDVHVQWPYAYVADGPGGLAIVDVRAPIAPALVAGIDVQPNPNLPNAAIGVEALFQYSRPTATADGRPAAARTAPRNLCAVLDEAAGLVLVDVTEPTRPEVLWPRPGQATRARANTSYRGLALQSHVDLASPQGGTRTDERDYAYVLAEVLQGNGASLSQLVTIDVTDPERPRGKGRTDAGLATEMLVHASFYNAPLLQTVLLTTGQQGVLATDASVSAEPTALGALQAIVSAYAVAVEEFPLDRMVSEDGRRLKDVSHAGSRWLFRSEIERVLSVPGEALGTVSAGDRPAPIPGMTTRLHFRRLDADRSGFLEGGEYELGGGARTDLDGDGRLTLLELARSAQALGLPRTEVAGADASPFVATRTGPEGDLTRLFDGVNPYAFDADGDGRLDRNEARRALLAALDLDGSGRLSRAEASRHPGALRELRFADARAEAVLAARDLDRDGELELRELVLEDAEWTALDRDGDGYVQLEVEITPWQRERGFLGPRTEWPARRAVVTGLPPVVSVERLIAVFDADGDGKLSQRELRRRPDLLADFDADGDSHVDARELDRAVAVVGQLGVEATLDGFLARWDLDRNGKVSAAELPPGATLPLRLRHLAE